MPDIFQLAQNPSEFYRAVGVQNPTAPAANAPRDIFQLARDPQAFYQAVGAYDPEEEERKRERRRQELANAPAGRLASAIETERVRRQEQSTTDYIAEHAVGAIGRRLPFVGSAIRIADAFQVRGAALRIRDNKAEAGDFDMVAKFMLDTEESEKRGFLGKVWDIITELPAFATEFAVTKGAFSAGRTAALSLAQRATTRAATAGVAAAAGTAAAGAAGATATELTAGLAAREAAAFGAGVVAHTLANPLRVYQEASRRSIPTLSPGQGGQLNISDPGNPWQNIGAGFLDTMIELGSERAGEALPWLAGKARAGLGRFPAIASKLDDVASRWTGSAVGRTVARWEGGTTRLAQALGVPYHGIAGEMFEERVGELLRGLTGLGDFGAVGDVLTGRMGQAGEQILAEAVAFSAIPFSLAAAHKASMKLRGYDLAGMEGLPEDKKAEVREAAVVEKETIDRAINALRFEISDNPSATQKELSDWIEKTYKDSPKELRDLLKYVAQSSGLWTGRLLTDQSEPAQQTEPQGPQRPSWQDIQQLGRNPVPFQVNLPQGSGVSGGDTPAAPENLPVPTNQTDAPNAQEGPPLARPGIPTAQVGSMPGEVSESPGRPAWQDIQKLSESPIPFKVTFPQESEPLVYKPGDIVVVKGEPAKVVEDKGGPTVVVREAGAAPNDTTTVKKESVERIGGNPLNSKDAYQEMRQQYPDNVEWTSADKNFLYGTFKDSSGGAWEVIAGGHDTGVEFFTNMGKEERKTPPGPRNIMPPPNVSREEWVSMQEQEAAAERAIKEKVFAKAVNQLEGVHEKIIGPMTDMARAFYAEDEEGKAKAAEAMWDALYRVLGTGKFADRVMMRLAPEYGGKGMLAKEIAVEEGKFSKDVTENAVSRYLARAAKQLGFKDGFPKVEVPTEPPANRPSSEQAQDLIIGEGVTISSRPTVALKDYEEAAHEIGARIHEDMLGKERDVTSGIVAQLNKSGKTPSNELIQEIYRRVIDYVVGVAKKAKEPLPDLPPLPVAPKAVSDLAESIVNEYITNARGLRDKNKPVGKGFDKLPEALFSAKDNVKARVNKVINNALGAIGMGGPAHSVNQNNTPPEQAKSVAAIRAWMRDNFDQRAYTTKNIYGMKNARAVATFGSRAYITTNEAEQNLFIAIEEQFHILSMKGDLESNPNVLPPNVLEGILDFGEYVGHDRQPTRSNVYEGAAGWYLFRVLGRMNDFVEDSVTMKEANEYLEKWLGDNKLTEKSDTLQAMMTQYMALDPVTAAKMLLATSGKPTPAPKAPVEQAKGWLEKTADWFMENIDTDLWAFHRIAKHLKKTGKSLAYVKHAISLYNQFSRRAASLAEEWGKIGVYGLDNGQERSYGGSNAEIMEGADREWFASAIEKGKSYSQTLMEAFKLYEKGSQPTIAGTYATANHLIKERQAGYAMISEAQGKLDTARNQLKMPGLSKEAKDKIIQNIEFYEQNLKDVTERAQVRINLVPDHMYDTFNRAHEVLMQDPKFAAWAPGFAVRLNHAFNANLQLLSAPDVHRLSRVAVNELIDYYGDWYVPTTRVREDVDWKMDPSSPSPGRGERMRSLLKSRSGGGEAIIDPIQSLATRRLMTAHVYIEQLKRNAVARVLLQPGMGNWATMISPEGTLGASPTLTDDQVRSEVGDAFHEMDELKDMLGAYAIEQAYRLDQTKPTWYWYGPEGNLYAWQMGDRGLYNLATSRQGDDSTFVAMLRGIINWDIGFGIKPVGSITSAVRRGATTLNLGYTLFRNTFITRDPYEFIKNTINLASAGRLPEMYKRLFMWEVNRLMGKVNDDYPLQLFMEHLGGDLRMMDLAPNVDAPITEYSFASWLMDKGRQFLKVTSSPELAPRFLEFLNAMEREGWTEEKLKDAHKLALEESAFVGSGYQSPIPFNLLLDSGQYAAEVTVPFNRQGVITREINRVIPFFGPAVSGLSKSIRNWKDNPKGAATGLGIMLTLRAMHWLIVHDEDWYKELSPADRFNNFVINVPGMGVVRFPGFRDLDVPVGGMMISVFDAAAKQNPDFPGLLRQSIEAAMPPTVGKIANDVLDGAAMSALGHTLSIPAGPAGAAAIDLLSNRGWGGRPIVPRRDEALPEWEQNINHRLPYLARQVTGGRMPTSLSGLGLVPFSSVNNNRRSMDEVYAQLDDLSRERASARRQMREFNREPEYQVLNRAADLLNALSLRIRGQIRTPQGIRPGNPPTPEEVADLRERQTEIAREAIARAMQIRADRR